MIKVKRNVFTNQIRGSVMKLSGAPVSAFDVPTFCSLGKLKKEYLSAFKDHLELRDEFIKEYCMKDEKGNPETTKGPGGTTLYKFEGEGADQYTKKMDELNDLEVELNVRKLTFKISEFPKNILNGDDFANLWDTGLVEFIDDSEETKE